MRRWGSDPRVLLGLRYLVGAAVGAVGGWLLFSVTSASGLTRFLVAGALIGLLVIGANQIYNRYLGLTEVKVMVPQFSELTFVVTGDSRQIAWQLFVETTTRVSTQPLDGTDGLLREAMTSLYGLFQTTRETLKAAQPSRRPAKGPTVEELAIGMLNRELRPFLSRWHPRLQAFEAASPGQPETAWPENQACRQELRAVQERLATYATGFGRLAGVSGPEDLLRPS